MFCIDRNEAVDWGNNIVEKHFAHAAKKDTEKFQDDDTLYRLLEDDESNALNADVSSDCQPRPGNYNDYNNYVTDWLQASCTRKNLTTCQQDVFATSL